MIKINSFEFKYEIIYHKDFESDLKKILKKYRQYKEKITVSIRHYSKILQKFGIKVIPNDPHFDFIKNADNLYEIRLTKKKPNLRIIFSVVDSITIIYLNIFYEKSKNDYDKYIDIAKQRFRDFKEKGGD
ncbi:type II toxin-antitoxin system RelE/ParE family toxin [Thermosipho sp. 1074]|uniref:type II toxin-antitoxin system RelE/ParE family toxin n=1 Tax=Thermosipho sp. 1074 TaxID=1643331 RepID=UPI0009D29916|nr:type II toxin-antitoxin system RelE/ParE family toxin [Thermosipho sp. 1074]OOC42157.1 hypothetical protein XO08_07675 [Thermosipho sp. 1074]